MERTNNPASEQPIRFKKVGGGSLRLFGRIIKPGQEFKALPSEIPQAFRDVVIPLETIPAEKPVEVIQTAEKPVYKLKPRDVEDSAESDAEDLYDVVNVKTNKALNDKGLDKKTAEKLIKDLEK